MKTILASLALALAMTLALAAAPRAEESEASIQGPIQRIESDGRLRVNGHALVVDRDTYITDRAHRTVSPTELVAGVEVEVVYYQTSRGEYAKEIVATIMR